MKNQKTTVSAVMLAALLTASLLSACGEAAEPPITENTPSETPVTGTAETEAAETDPYSYPQTYAGSAFRVLNAEDIFSYHEVIDPKEATGETFNDARYNCCRTFEEKTGVTYEETQIDLQSALGAEVPKLILAGEDLYDIIYIGSRELTSFSAAGYLVNLLDVGTLNLSEDWWLHESNDLYISHNTLYRAEGYAQMSIVDGIGVLMFNETMAQRLDLELPYQAVLDGKWTLDMFYTYAQTAANLNGDAAFKWSTNGACTWGVVFANNNTGLGLTMAGGERLIDYDASGKLVLTAGTDRFYSVCEAAGRFFDKAAISGGISYLGTLTDDEDGSYINAFERERTLFGQSEIAKTNRMRNSDFTFGVLPYPKYDEAQTRYYSGKSYPSLGISIAVTSADPERAGALADAFNYLGYRMIWPVFREITLEQKNLRNEESILMLDVILQSSAPDLTSVFNISFDTVANKIKSGSEGVASALAKQEKKIQAKLDEINELE